MKWSETLLNWYYENKRELPWRKTDDPYHIWLSEIILQQTRVDQGLSYYKKFIQNYPTVFDLAAAKEDEVLKLWQGLGYYSRARNLHASAQWIVDKNKGVFPQTFKQLLLLKGVGDYTASAISSICFDEPQAVVDGNVYRFLSRCFGISTPVDSSTAHKEFKTVATRLMKGFSPGDFNQAVMEFGAIQCTPKNAHCSVCPFSSECRAFQEERVYEFPIKKKRTKVRKRFFNYLVVETPKGNTTLKQRTGPGIWQNLYEFPLLETDKSLTLQELSTHKNFPSEYKINVTEIDPIGKQPVKHLLSHQHLFIRFWGIKLEKEIQGAMSLMDIKKLPVPVVIQHFIDNHYTD